PKVCLEMVERLKSIGVDEIACLIDFGVDSQLVLDHLPHLDEVRARANQASLSSDGDYRLATLIARHKVTHMQCTPSMAGMLLNDSTSRTALGTLKKLMVG